MPHDEDATGRALLEGANRSREASSAASREPLAVRVWRRFQWTIIGLLLFVLFEFVLMGGFGSRRSP